MPKERSPNYPAISLEEAIKRAQVLFKTASRTAVAPLVAVKGWGYTGLNGVSRTRLAALRHYGLTEVDKTGNVKLSRRGLTFAMRSADSPEYIDAIKEAALTPTIFRDLYETRNGVSDEALRHYLVVEKKFSPDGARRVLETYRSTIEFANLGGDRYTDDTEEEFDVEQKTRQDSHQDSYQEKPRQSSEGAFVEQYRWPLSGGVTAEVTFRGNRVTLRELELLREYLLLAEKALDSANAGVAQEEQCATSTASSPEQRTQA